jgi:thiol-disulfide isomerase/thioredoxin
VLKQYLNITMKEGMMMPLVPAPSFCLPDLEGRLHSLGDYRGKVVWLEFWVSWCAACQALLPKKERLHRVMQHPDVVFLTVNVTGREPEPNRVRPFLQEQGYRFPVLLDNGRQTYDAFGIRSVPATVLISKDGMIHGIYDETVPLLHIIAELGKLLPPNGTSDG